MSDANKPEFEIDIALEDRNWAKALTDIGSLAHKAVQAACLHIKARPFSELSLAFMSDRQVQTLNHKYRGQDKPTNVLSFTGESGSGFAPLLGDIVLGYETVSAETKQRGISLEHHVSHLLIHGFLHLQGYDHQTPTEALAMEKIEIAALGDLGIANPYDKDMNCE